MADETNVAVAEPEVEQASSPEAVQTPLTDLFAPPVRQEAPKASPAPEVAKDEQPATSDEKAETPSLEKEEAVKPDPITELKTQYEERLKQTRDWTTKVNQENAQLKQTVEAQNRYLEMINKKLDGTWTDEDDKALQAPQGPTPEEAMQYGNLQGRIDASRNAAAALYGKETIDKMLFAPDAPFAQIMDDPIVRQKVLSSDAPVIEAMKIVEVKQFYDRYGYEPKTIEANIKAAYEKELTEKIMKKLSQRQPVPSGLRDVRGAAETVPAGGITPLKELFG